MKKKKIQILVCCMLLLLIGLETAFSVNFGTYWFHDIGPTVDSPSGLCYGTAGENRITVNNSNCSSDQVFGARTRGNVNTPGESVGGYVTFYSNGVQNSYYYSRFKDPITNQFDMLDGKYLFIRCKKDDASDDVVNMLYVSGYFSPG